ncbi:DUF2141 domain-containing protein [Persicitalea sp.]|uniref:DUF2141 domain-containing protein n=1 Tax=Persicitalea sp. TaxID=3100273 RepID=UPI0035945281
MLIAFVLLLLFFDEAPAETTRLSVEITNIQTANGTLRIGLFKPGARFGKKDSKPFLDKLVPVNKLNPHKTEFIVEPGTYAVALYHDLNDNRIIDKNFFGFPKEPFGLSNNFRPFFSAPDFEDCAFELTERGKSISIKLID